jgi:hypothetical protein
VLTKDRGILWRRHLAGGFFGRHAVQAAGETPTPRYKAPLLDKLS